MLYWCKKVGICYFMLQAYSLVVCHKRRDGNIASNKKVHVHNKVMAKNNLNYDIYIRRRQRSDRRSAIHASIRYVCVSVCVGVCVYVCVCVCTRCVCTKVCKLMLIVQTSYTRKCKSGRPVA